MCRKIITLLLLGGYSLAVTVGGAFHTHIGSDCGTTENKSSGHCHSHACHAGHTHTTPSNSREQSESPTLERRALPFDSHCPICSFLAQKPIPVVTKACEHSVELRQPLVRVRAIPPSDDIPSTVFGRGPPSLG
jgi:hypothetical protein